MLAPLVYMVGRLSGNLSLSAQSADLDPMYFRGYVSRSRAGAQSQDYLRFYQAARLCASSMENIDERVVLLFSKSHGQNLQDIMCCMLHQEKRYGYFVEVGVGNGTYCSNSLMLERDFGWKGLLAEPARMFHAPISKTRSSILAPQAVTAISGQTLQFEEDTEIGELSGLSGQRTARGNQNIARYDVKTITLDDLLAAHDAPDVIDFLSIDTEGSEMDVLAGLTLDQRKINFISIEHNDDQARQASYARYFGRLGYRKISDDLSVFDAWYVHPDIKPIRF